MWADIEKKLNHLKLINEQDPLSKLNFKTKVKESLSTLSIS